MTTNELIFVYGTDWCGDCIRAKRFFDQNKIPYRWVNIDHDEAGEKTVLEVNHGNRSVPTIIFPDGSILVEPSTHALSLKCKSI
jgi:mycoredoxin